MPTENLDTIIAVLHPSTAPQVVSTGGALEFETNDDLIPPPQRRLKNALVRALSDFASRRQKSGLFVTSTLRIQPDDVEIPASCVIRLTGASVTMADVAEFQSAARLLLNRITPQTDLWNQPAEGMLQEESLDVLQPMAAELAQQFAGRTIKQGVMVRFGGAETDAMRIQGSMPALTIEHSATQLISGTARPVGFDEFKNLIALYVNSATDDEQLL